MEILFMGTGAAEAVPALFCDCAFCRYARKKGAREIRTRSGALIDGRLKLDFGPDTHEQMLRYGLNFSTLRSVLITHSHEDHLTPGEIECRRRKFAYPPEGTGPLTVYGNENVAWLLENAIGPDVRWQRMVPFETVRVEDWLVTALEAVHCVDAEGSGWPVVYENRTVYRKEQALFYLIERDSKSILYAHDTDWFTPEDMRFLAGRKISLISLDCTHGKQVGGHVGHMGCDVCLRLRGELLNCGAADEHTLFVANHFSHNGLVPLEELQLLMPGFIIAYDGLVLRV